MFLKLFVLIVFVCDVLCQSDVSSTFYSYQLPEISENKSLNITIRNEYRQQVEIRVECYNYDSLKFLEVRQSDLQIENGVLLHFKKCFNNATDNENYYYDLARKFNSLPYFNTTYRDGYPIGIQFDEYAAVNSDTFFKNFDFNKFSTVIFRNLGFKSTTFFNNLYCQHCVFENNGVVDFNDFNSNTVAKTDTLQIFFNKLINLNKNNLKKFKHLTFIALANFDLDEANVFNVPDLFEHNENLTEIAIQRSKLQLVLHEHVFRGLTKIRAITLKDLHLNTLPKNLFKDLETILYFNFALNNIKAIDPTMFQTNTRLKTLSFEDNPFYTKPHNKLETFKIHGDSSYISLSNFTAHTFDLLELLIKNQNVSMVAFQSFEIDTFNLTNFLKLNVPRTIPINVYFWSGEPVLDWEYIKSNENIIRSRYDVSDLNVIIGVSFSGDAMCHDCTIIKRIFPSFVNHYNNMLGFYVEGSGVFIKFKIPESCNHLEENFDKSFEENCPINCACKFNSLLDKVKINCANKNFTEIPLIPYPVQYDKLVSLDLNFENNSISVLSTKNQDTVVLKKLSTLNFKNNKIGALQFDELNLLINNVAMNLCGNPMAEAIQDSFEIKLPTGSKYLNRFKCVTDDEFERVANYLKIHKTTEEINEYLNGLECI